MTPLLSDRQEDDQPTHQKRVEGERPSASTSASALASLRRGPSAGSLAVLRHRISWMRAVTFGAIMAYSVFLRATSLPGLPLNLILVLGAIEIAAVVPYRSWYESGRARAALVTTTFVVDLIALTIVLAAMPGAPAVFHLFYLLVIVPAALASLAGGLLATTVATFSHVAILMLRDGTSIGSAELFVPIVLFLVVGQQSLQYGRRLAQLAAEAETESVITAALLRASRELATFATSTELLRHVADLARALTAGEWACVLLRDARRGTYRTLGLASRTGIIDEEVHTLEIPAGDFPDALIARAGDGCVAIAADDPVIPPSLRERWRMGALLAAPLRRAEAPSGLLLVGMDAGACDSTSQRLVVGIAAQAALALENARLLDDLRAASALKTEFMSTMSHELRSPLNAILGYVEMLREEDGEPGNATRESRRKLLTRVDVHALQLLEMITATLDVSRLESGRLPVTLAPIALSTVIADVRSTVPEYWRKPQVGLEWPRGELPIVETDAAKVKTILRNLVHNALKFTDAGRVVVSIDVTEESDGDPAHGTLTLSVCDSGIGIAPDRQAVIFDMFRQVDGSDSRRHGGVGLGLYIVQRLVQVLDGAVHVESVEGVGSEFVVTLPVRVSATLPAATNASTKTVDVHARARFDAASTPLPFGRTAGARR